MAPMSPRWRRGQAGSEAPSWDEQVARSRALLEERQQRFVATIASFGHWHYDLDEAVIEFSKSGSTISHRIVVAGSTSASGGTWLWGWANESFPGPAVAGIEAVRAYGKLHDYDLLVSEEWPAREPLVGDVAAVAGDLLGANGYFRTTGGDVSLYLLIDPALPQGDL